MTRQGALSPLTLLLVSLLCYGFVLVWTQNVALETTTTFEDHSTPFSPARVNVLTGGNFSVSVPQWESTVESPAVSTQSNVAVHNVFNENASTAMPEDSVSIPLPTTMESPSTMVSTDSAEATTDDELNSAMGSTKTLLSTAANNALSALTERQRFTTELEMTSRGSTGMVEANVSSPTSEHTDKVSTGTTITHDTPITSAGVSASSNLAALPRTVKRSSSVIHTGRMTWRLTLRSSLSRERAIKEFFEKACDVIIKNLHMKDLSITLGPDQTMKCL